MLNSIRKFYKTVDAGTAPGGYAIRLDGKPVRTPLKAPLLVESKDLAEAIAAEWRAQGDEVKPWTMPLTQLANTMTDKGRGKDREEMEDQLHGYAASDLVCYFADHPQELVKRHQKHWLPLVRWMSEKYGIVFETVSGIQYKHQPKDSLDKLRDVIEGLSQAGFTVVQAAAATTGSVVIALALMEKKLSAEEAYEAVCVDELYQLEKWGEDAEARKRLDTIRSELSAITTFRDLVR